jgi:transcription antitermination factor NusG
MGKIELEALRRRARSIGIDLGTLARAARAKRSSFGIGSRQPPINEPPAPVLVAPSALPMDGVRRWVVAVCKPSMARGVADDLNELGFVAYCPLSRKVHLRARARVGRRKIIRQYPVFGVYIFVGEVDGPLQASIHSGISYLVGDSHGAWSLDPSFVLARNRDELAGKWDETKTPVWERKDLIKFKKGKKVSVLSGPFASFGGFVEECSKAGIKVGLDIFGRVTPVEFEPSALEMA